MKQETRFQVDGIEFVSGLEWVTLDAQGRERPPMLGGVVIGHPGPASRKELSRIEGASSAVWRTTEDDIAQFGVSLEKPGAISLAAFVANILEREDVNTFIAVFQVDESLYALAGAVDGLVQMTAEVAGDRETIRKHAQEELSVSDPNILIIAPEGFGIGETRHDSIADFIAQAQKGDFQSAKLVRLAPNYRAIGTVVVSIALVAGGVTGGWHWYQQKKMEEQMRIAQEMMRQQNQNKQGVQQVEPEVDIVSVSKALNACYQAFAKVDLYPGGWLFSGARCVPGDLSIQFKRNGSRIMFLRKVYPHAVVSLNGQSAEVHFPVNIEQVKIKASKLGNADQLVDRFNDAVLSFGLNATLSRKAIPQPVVLPGRDNPNPQPQTTWKTFGWSLQDVSQGLTLKAFDFTGMSFKEMSITPQAGGNSIIVKGELYGN